MKTDAVHTLYAAQAPIVWETLQRDGVYYVKHAYVSQKYEESAWIFRTAYRAFIRRMIPLVPKPEEAETPVWLYPDPRYATVARGTVVMRLKVPREEVVFFDQRDWNRILNLSPIGTEEEIDSLEKELRRQGVSDFCDLFVKPYYPVLRKKVEDTWNRLLTSKDPDPSYAQAASWRLCMSWVEEYEIIS